MSAFVPVSSQRQAGFSLLEIMVVVAIIAIIGAISVPSFQQLTRRSRLAAAGNEFVAAMQTARMTAVSKRQTVNLCPSADGAACAASIGSRWIIRTASGEVVKDITVPAGIAVLASTNLSNASFKLGFGPSGFSKAGTGGAAPTSATISVCANNVRGENALDVTASMGRVSTFRRSATAACTTPAER